MERKGERGIEGKLLQLSTGGQDNEKIGKGDRKIKCQRKNRTHHHQFQWITTSRKLRAEGTADRRNTGGLGGNNQAEEALQSNQRTARAIKGKILREIGRE